MRKEMGNSAQVLIFLKPGMHAENRSFTKYFIIFNHYNLEFVTENKLLSLAKFAVQILQVPLDP